MDIWELSIALCVGIGLSAACGFRVFVPLLVMSIAAKADYIALGSGFDWIGSTPALIAFSVATALEIAAYYVPWVDNLLDSIATPAAFVAGTIITSGMVSGQMNPMFQWSLGIIAGGGAALTTQAVTVATRAASTLTTGGLGNPVVSTAEAGGALIIAILAVVIPLITVLLFIMACIWFARWWMRRRAVQKKQVTIAPLNGVPPSGVAS